MKTGLNYQKIFYYIINYQKILTKWNYANLSHFEWRFYHIVHMLETTIWSHGKLSITQTRFEEWIHVCFSLSPFNFHFIQHNSSPNLNNYTFRAINPPCNLPLKLLCETFCLSSHPNQHIQSKSKSCSSLHHMKVHLLPIFL